MTPDIPFVDLRAQQAEIHQAVMEDLERVFREAGFVGGPEVDGFEEEYARYTGVSHCVGVANGTDAVEIALRAVGIGPGCEVILPANTFIATAEAVVRAGATPVLVDADETTLLIDPGQVARALSPRTRAVMPCTCSARPRRSSRSRTCWTVRMSSSSRMRHSPRARRAVGCAPERSAWWLRRASTRARTSVLAGTPALSRPTTRNWQPEPGCCRTTAASTSTCTRPWASTPAWTPSRRWCCGTSSGASTRGTCCGDGPPTLLRTAGRM